MNREELKDDIYEDHVQDGNYCEHDYEIVNGDYVFKSDGNEVVFSRYSLLSPIENIQVIKNGNEEIEVDSEQVIIALYEYLKKEGKLR